MNAAEIGSKINPHLPGVYSPTDQPTELMMIDGSTKAGYFANVEDSFELEPKNIFTFVEFGENAQKFRATGDKKYVTYINGDEIFDVIYPAKSPLLSDRINRLKIYWGKQGEDFWRKYRDEWRESVNNLVAKIVYEWLKKEEDQKLLSTEVIYVKKTDPYIGEHTNTRLEITIPAGDLLVLDPVAPITSEYDGRADFFSLVKLSNRVVLLRQLIRDGEFAWAIAETSNRQKDKPLNEKSFKSILQKWGYLS